MPMTLLVLADVPRTLDCINLYKLGAISALLIGWVFACQWVDKDAEFVKTKRERWNLIVLVSGLAGIVVLFLVPWAGNTFALGLGFWLLLAGGGALMYVFHRNGRVMPVYRVLTFGHVKRLLAREEGSKGAKVDRGQRIELTNHEGKTISRPTERDEFEFYASIQEFLFDVLWRRASDVDVVMGKEKPRVIYRIDGVVAERSDALTVEDADRVLVYIKRLGGLNPEEVRRPQEGAVSASLLGEATLSRISVMTSGTTQGERLRLRLQKPTAKKRLEELGLAESRLEQLKKLINVPKGLLLVSGIKGGGVTTAQYAVLRTHDAFMKNIHLLETKAAYDLDNITQVKYAGPGDGVSFARQLQSVLRREPDIVGIGECGDRETAQIALRAAAADRKIYMAIEGKSAFDALSRLMAFAEDNALTAGALVGVLNCRLLRVLCPSCRQSFKPDEELLKKANIPVDRVENFHRPPTEPVLDRRGREIICQTCQGSGYVGRTGVFELLVVNDEIRQLIAAGAPIKNVKAAARKGRMYYMQEEGLLKVIDGTTSLDEVIRGLRDDAK